MALCYEAGYFADGHKTSFFIISDYYSLKNENLTLGYRPPYQWRKLLEFLAKRTIPGVEVVTGDEYMRTVHYVNSERKHFYGWLRVGHRPQKNALTVTVSSALLLALTHILARVRNLFDLYCYPDAVYETLSVMDTMKPGLCVPGTRPSIYGILYRRKEIIMFYTTDYASPVGAITLGSDGENLVGLWMAGQKYFAETIKSTAEETVEEKSDLSIFVSAKKWLDAYFAGKQPAISELPLAPYQTVEKVTIDFFKEV